MKVIRITTSLDYGGIEKVFELHAKYHKRNYELILLSLGKGGNASSILEGLGYRVINLESEYKIPSWRCFTRLMDVFKSEKPDVVHTCGAEANFHGLLAAFFSNVKRRVGEEIGIPHHSKIVALIFKIVYLTAHRVIAISEAVKKYLIKFEAPAEKVVVVYNPVDIKLDYKKDLAARNTYRISFVGRLEPIKNLTILIDLLTILKEKYKDRLFELWLIGEGSQRKFLTAYAEKKEIEHSVHFKGFVPEPQKLLVQTDVFILPSLFEGFGLACVEAIQCGLPVIVSKSGGMVEYITDGVNGFLFDPHSMNELVQKTEMLMSWKQDKLDQMISNATSTIQKLFSPERYLAELEQVYGFNKEQPK